MNLRGRLPEAMYRVLAEGGKRAYWEGASKTYTDPAFVAGKASEYRRNGASEVRVFKAVTTWIDVTEEVAPQ